MSTSTRTANPSEVADPNQANRNARCAHTAAQVWRAKLPAATVEYNKKLINSSYELMGVRQVIERSLELESIALASRDSSPEIDEFNTIREKDGLKAALSWNAKRFVDEDAWFKKSRDRG